MPQTTGEGLTPYQPKRQGSEDFPSPAGHGETGVERQVWNQEQAPIVYDDQSPAKWQQDSDAKEPVVRHTDMISHTPGLGHVTEAREVIPKRQNVLGKASGNGLLSVIGNAFKRKEGDSNSGATSKPVVSHADLFPDVPDFERAIPNGQSHRRSVLGVVQDRKQLHDDRLEREKSRHAAAQKSDIAAIQRVLELEQIASEGWKNYEQIVLERAENDRIEAEKLRREAVEELNKQDMETTGQLFRGFHNALRTPDPISTSQLPGTRTGEYLGKFYDATRASHAGKILEDGEVVPGNGLSLVPQMGELVAVDGEWHTPEDRRQYVARIFDTVAQTHANYPGVLDSHEPDEHDHFIGHISGNISEITKKATEEAINSYYRLDTATTESHARSAFEEDIEALGLNADEWEVGKDGYGEEALYLNDGVYAVLDDDKEVHLFRNPNVRGLSKLIDNKEIGKFHNVLPGLSVEGWIKTPKHPSGGSAMLATYDSDKIIPSGSNMPVQAIMKTRIRPVALTSEGLGVAQAASHAIRNEQSGVDPVISPLIEAERGLKARLKQYFNMAQFSKDYIDQAANAESGLPTRPSRVSEDIEQLARIFNFQLEVSTGPRQEQSNGSHKDANSNQPELQNGQEA